MAADRFRTPGHVRQLHNYATDVYNYYLRHLNKQQNMGTSVAIVGQVRINRMTFFIKLYNSQDRLQCIMVQDTASLHTVVSVADFLVR